MATYTVTEIIRHGFFSSVNRGQGKNLYEALGEVLSLSPYYSPEIVPLLVRKFCPTPDSALHPRVGHGWADYYLTITPDPED